MNALAPTHARIGVHGIGHSTACEERPEDVDPTGRLDRLPSLIRVGVRAARQAMNGAAGGDDIALVVATRHGAADDMARFLDGLSTRGHARADPFLFPNLLYNAVAGEIAIRAAIRGPNITVTAGGTCGASLLETALLLLHAGRARRVLAVSIEAGGTVLGTTYARLRRRGLARTGALSRVVPFAEDTASALLLSAAAGDGIGVRRACTGYASAESDFAAFIDQAGHGLDIVRVVHLDEETPVFLGRFLSAARSLPEGRCGLVVHRAEDGGCGAVAFER